MDSLWMRTIGTSNGDQGTSLTLGWDSLVVACGYKDVSGITQGRGWVSKLFPETGNEIWSREYIGRGSQDIFTYVTRDYQDNLICCGWSRNPSTNDQDYWLYKMTDDGDSVWSRTYGHEFANQATCVLPLPGPTSGYLVAGRAHSVPGGFGQQDWWILRVNSDGDSLWSRLIGGPFEDTCTDMMYSNNGGILLIGHSLADSTRLGRIVEFNGITGEVRWDSTYDIEPNIELYDISPTAGGYFICGAAHGWNEDNDPFVMRIDNQGNVLWSHRYYFDIAGSAVAHKFSGTYEGRHYLIGHAQRTSTTDNDIFMLYVTECGDSVRTHWFGSQTSTELSGSITAFDSTIIALGVNVSAGNQRDILLYGLSADTCNIPPCDFTRVAPEDSTMPDLQMEGFVALTWTPSHDSEGAPIQYIFDIESTYPEQLFISPQHVVSTDTFYHLELMLPVSPLDEIFDFRWTVKATDGIDTVEASNGEGFFQLDIIMDADENVLSPSDFTLSAYPNPFNPTTTLSFTLSQPTHVNLDLFDIQGRLVQSLVNNMMNTGSHSIAVDGTSLSSGIYFANLRANNQTRIAKLVLMK